MDAIDRQLLDLLKIDGRAAVLDLARKLKLSRTATQARMAKLKASGKIRRFTIEEGESSEITAHVFVKMASGRKCASLVPHIKTLSAAEMIHSVTGEYDLIIKIRADTIEGIESCRAAIASLEGVAALTTAMTLTDHRR